MSSETPMPPDVLARILRAFQHQLDGVVLGDSIDPRQLAGHLGFVCEVLADLIEATGHVQRHVERDDAWEIRAWHEGDDDWEAAWETFAEAAGPPTPEAPA